MGCDIHPVIEIKSKYDDEWKLAACRGVPQYRSYSAFALLAGVRGGDPVIPPRGLPEDLSNETKLLMDQKGLYLGDHSFSWLTLEELDRDDFSEDDCWLIFDLAKLMRTLMENYYGTDENGVRVVFGFDS